MSEEKMEQVFEVSTPARLVVKNIRGSVKVTTGEEGSILVSAIKNLDSGDSKLTELELSQEKDGTVKAVVRFPEGSLGWLSGQKPCKVDFIIQTPRQCSSTINTVSSDVSVSGQEGKLECRTVSGDIDLHELTGELNVHSVSGDVDLEQISGNLDIHTVSGDVDGKSVSGEANLDTVSGDITLEKSTLPAIKGKSVSGDFKMETSLADGPYDFHSVSGDVNLKVPAETSCKIELHALSGGISSQLSETSSVRDHGHQSVEVQGGGVLVTMKSVSGDLSLAS